MSSLNVLLTSTCWRNDHNGFSHQGPGLHRQRCSRSRRASCRVWLPPDANTTLSVTDHCLRSVDHVNLIVVDKQPHLQYLDLEEAHRHCAPGAGDLGVGEHAPRGRDPRHRASACAGDVPTQEALAAAELLREHVPDLRVRFVNVVDLMALLPEDDHPHGYTDSQFDDLFTADRRRRLRLPRLPARGAPARARPLEPRPLPRARLHASRARRRRRSTWSCSTG